MDAVQELVEQSSEEMREEIDCTRSDLAEKLEALEDSVMGTVQSAQETVEDSIQIAKDTVATVKRTFDIKNHVEQHPWVMVGGCFVAGLAVGALVQGMYRQPRQTPDRPAEKEIRFSANPARLRKQRGSDSFAAAARLLRDQLPPPSAPGVFALFHDEIAKVKEMAIGYVMGLARDALKESAPHLAAKIDDVMNSATTKLGGEPVQQPST
jgi:ElaB/YqjD/DUF883 family membrane-anchored ribosome-binding protein